MRPDLCSCFSAQTHWPLASGKPSLLRRVSPYALVMGCHRKLQGSLGLPSGQARPSRPRRAASRLKSHWQPMT
ncbi:hypothetical protein BT67DRAFT_445909 [Trichocladium antarcticum]|uniref:Uncharacterized protein n=1 Tax=Trichocladium antarcticum TaxID=1450529 RepID=A0AAN6Z9L8_9PEZI|nr:hypothetical protein BT67DRAFT_445909 [Trichocladium antarcticum]